MVKAYHHGDLREQLLNAGERALGEMSVDRVTLREIARRAGVSHAAPKHHFPSLGHLLAEIAARGFYRFVAALNEAADAAPEQSAHQRLMAMGRAYLKFASQNPAAYQLMFGHRELMVMTPNLIAASYAAWQQLNAAAAAVAGPQKANSAALHVWSSVHGLSLLKQAGRLPPDLPLYNIEEQMLRMMMEGLMAE